jgi:predicted TIM-barrel fold metal-dependent hydrolase
MKVSGLVEGAGRPGNAPAELDFYRPVLDTIWEAFGEDRVIFGSNWPVSSRFARYDQVLWIVRDYFEPKGRGVAGKYFFRNAERVYGWPKRA